MIRAYFTGRTRLLALPDLMILLVLATVIGGTLLTGGRFSLVGSMIGRARGWAIIRRLTRPADCQVVLCQQVEQALHRIHLAVTRDLAEGLAHDARIRARDDLHVVQVAMEQLLVVREPVLAEVFAESLIAQEGAAFGVAQARRVEDVIDRYFRPRERIVGAHHDLARAHLMGKVLQRLRREHQRIEVELVEVFGRLLLQLDVGIAVLRRHEAGVVGARRVGAEVAAAMRRDDL